MNANKKHALENFIVAKAVTTMPTSGTLSNTSTGAFNLSDGQLGLASASIYGSVAMNTFLGATPSIDNAPVMAIYQGTSASANPNGAVATYPLSVRSHEKTANIDGRAGVTVTKQVYREAKHNLWVVGGIPAGVTDINIADETEYRMRIAYRGYRIEEFFSSEESAGTRVSITTPDFTNTPAITSPLDWIVTYLGWNINRNSQVLNIPTRFAANDPIVAIAVTATALGGTAIAGLTVGTFLPIVNTQFGLRGITLTQAMLDSIQTAATATSFTHVVTIDLANAGTATGGTAEGLFLMALNATTAFVDYIPQISTRMQVALVAGFGTGVLNSEAIKADPGQGDARVLDLMYRETEGQRKYNLRHEEFPVIEYPSPIDLTAKYVVYNIMHGKVSATDIIHSTFQPFRELILIPNTNTTLITNFEAALNPWLASGDNQTIVTVE